MEVQFYANVIQRTIRRSGTGNADRQVDSIHLQLSMIVPTSIVARQCGSGAVVVVVNRGEI